MNISQLKNPNCATSQLPIGSGSVDNIEKVECDGAELMSVIAEINARGDTVLSLNIEDRTHYVLNVQRNDKP